MALPTIQKVVLKRVTQRVQLVLMVALPLRDMRRQVALLRARLYPRILLLIVVLGPNVLVQFMTRVRVLARLTVSY